MIKMEHRPISDIQEEIVEEFEFLGDWPEKYEHLMNIGKKLPRLPEAAYANENKVIGCQSNVWLITHVEDGRIVFEGDSDALIVKGLVALLLKVFSNQTPDDILNANLDYIDRIGLQAHLSATRNNGLMAMVKQIKFYALAYKAKMSA
jgi:cysteine desulfuration protein SufE